MEGADFTELLERFASVLRWQPSIPCPCVLDTGAADRSCRVCLGAGRTWGDLSAPFEAPLIAQDARSRAALAQTMGPGMLGASTLIVGPDAPCYDAVRDGDRIWDTATTDQHRLILLPGVLAALPLGFHGLSALVKAADGLSLVSAPPPVPDAARRVQVAVPTTLSFTAPRGYEVIKDLSRVRSWTDGLPKKLTLSLIDMSAR